jgi:hypothetical protein
LKEITWTRAECFYWHAKNRHENILFKDKFFTIEEHYNNQNNEMYSQMSLEVCSEGAGLPSSFLRHGLRVGVPARVDMSSFLQESGETSVRVYHEDLLHGVVKHRNMTLFQWFGMAPPGGLSSCPKTKMTQQWLWRNIPAFFSAKFWPLGSPDLNPLDYNL